MGEEKLGFSTRDICLDSEGDSSKVAESEADWSSGTEVKVVPSGREKLVTRGGRSGVIDTSGQITGAVKCVGRLEEACTGTAEDLDLGKEISEAKEAEWLEVQELWFGPLGQLKGRNMGSLKLEKQGTVPGTGAVNKDCKFGLGEGVDKDGRKLLKSSMITWKEETNEKK